MRTDELLRSVSMTTPVDENDLIQDIAVLRNILRSNPEHSSYIEELPSDGYRFIGNVRDVIADHSEGELGLYDPRDEGYSKRFRRGVWATALGVIVVVFAVVAVVVSRTDTPPSALGPIPITSLEGVVGDPTFSPEGDRVAFAWNGEKEENFDIYVKLIGPGPPLRLTTNPAIDFTPAWSPDGTTIAFQRYVEGMLEIILVPALGGPERKIGEIYASRYQGDVSSPQLCWSNDGKFLVASGKENPGLPTSLFRFSVADGSSVKITSPDANDLGDFGPAFSPDGLFLAFCRVTHVGAAEIYVGRVGPDLMLDAAPRPVTADRHEAGSPAWTPDGKEIVFVSTRIGSRTTLWRIPVNPIESNREPVRVEMVGERVNHPAVANEAHRLAFIHQDFDTNIWTLRLGDPRPAEDATEMVIGSPRNEYDPDYSPDGKKIAFLSDRTGFMEVWISDSDGSNLIQLTNLNGGAAGYPRWSPDGKKVAFHAGVGGKAKIYVINASGGELAGLTSGQSEDLLPSWSHDGKWIYYASNRSGSLQVWKMRADGSDARQITRQGGFLALESKDGKTLYYAKYSRAIRLMNTPLWKVPVDGGEETQILERGPVFSRNFAVAAEGIYLIPSFTSTHWTLQFFRFANSSLVDVKQFWRGAQNGMALSPDGRSLLFTQVDHQDSEVMMVDNFH